MMADRMFRALMTLVVCATVVSSGVVLASRPAGAAPLSHSGNVTALGVCLQGERFCNNALTPIENLPRTACLPEQMSFGFNCIPSADRATLAIPYERDMLNGTGALDPIDPSAQWLFTSALDVAQKWTTELLGWMMSTAFGAGYSSSAHAGTGQRAFAAPVLFCQGAQGATQFGCQGNMPWFTNSFSMMRRIGLYLIAPMFFFMVIQSIAKGSMQMLLRGTFVVMPVAILATTFLLSFGQLLLNISDDFSAYIARKTVTPQIMQCAKNTPIVTSPNGTVNGGVPPETVAQAQSNGAVGPPGDLTSLGTYGACIQNSVASVATEKLGFAAYFWLPLLIFGSIVIYMELVLREIGVYSTVFFLPLAFAAMVWPAATKMAKLMVEILIGLIFSKVFVVAALSLGVSAMARMQTSTTEVAGANGQQVLSSDGGIQALIVGTIVILMAAFVQTKVIMMTPTSIAKTQGQMYNPQNLWAKGQLTATAINRANAFGGFIKRRINSNKGFKTGGSGGRLSQLQEGIVHRPPPKGINPPPSTTGKSPSSNTPPSQQKASPVSKKTANSTTGAAANAASSKGASAARPPTNNAAPPTKATTNGQTGQNGAHPHGSMPPPSLPTRKPPSQTNLRPPDD